MKLNSLCLRNTGFDKPLLVMCHWLSKLTTASCLSQEDFPLATTGRSHSGQKKIKNGSPPAGREATEDPCHPSSLFALLEPCQASGSSAAHTNTHAHAHLLNLATWKELWDRTTPPHLRPNLGLKQTKKTKRALIRTILLAALLGNGI